MVENLFKQKLSPQLKQLYSNVEGECVFGFEAAQLEAAAEEKKKLDGQQREQNYD